MTEEDEEDFEEEEYGQENNFDGLPLEASRVQRHSMQQHSQPEIEEDEEDRRVHS